MSEYDALSRSFKGSEGSGGAQVFDTSSMPAFLQRQAGLEQAEVAKKAKAQANLEKARGLINPKLPKAVYDQHIRQEIMPQWEAYTKSLYDNPNMTAEEMAAKKIEGQKILTDWDLGTVAYNEIQKKIAAYEALYAKADDTIDKEAIKKNIEILNNRLDPKNKDPENFAKYGNILAYHANVDDKELNSELKYHDPTKQTQSWMKDIKGVTRTWDKQTGLESVDYANFFNEEANWSKESVEAMMSKSASDFNRFKDRKIKGGMTQGEFFAQQAKEKGTTPLDEYQDYVLGTNNSNKLRNYYDKFNPKEYGFAGDGNISTNMGTVVTGDATVADENDNIVIDGPFGSSFNVPKVKNAKVSRVIPKGDAVNPVRSITREFKAENGKIYTVTANGTDINTITIDGSPIVSFKPTKIEVTENGNTGDFKEAFKKNVSEEVRQKATKLNLNEIRAIYGLDTKKKFDLWIKQNGIDLNKVKGGSDYLKTEEVKTTPATGGKKEKIKIGNVNNLPD